MLCGIFATGSFVLILPRDNLAPRRAANINHTIGGYFKLLLGWASHLAETYHGHSGIT